MSHDVTREQSESRKECLSQKLTHTLNMSRTVNILVPTWTDYNLSVGPGLART